MGARFQKLRRFVSWRHAWAVVQHLTTAQAAYVLAWPLIGSVVTVTFAPFSPVGRIVLGLGVALLLTALVLSWFERKREEGEERPAAAGARPDPEEWAKRTRRDPYSRAAKMQADYDRERKELVEAELAQVLDEAATLSGDLLTDVPYDRLVAWRKAVTPFLKAVLGPAAADRFEREKNGHPSNEAALQAHVDVLRSLLDTLDAGDLRRVGPDRIRAEIRRRREAPRGAISAAVADQEGRSGPPAVTDSALDDSPRLSAVLKEALGPEIVNGRELAGLLTDVPSGEEMYRVRSDIRQWRERVRDLLADHDEALAEWFSVEEHPQYRDDIVARLIVGYAGGEERLRLLNYMSQRIGKLDEIVARAS